EQEVWQEITSNGLEYHPIYDTGLPRLSCVYCVLAGPDWLILATRVCFALELPLPETYAALERRIGHSFNQNFTLNAVIAAAACLTHSTGPSHGAAATPCDSTSGRPPPTSTSQPSPPRPPSPDPTPPALTAYSRNEPSHDQPPDRNADRPAGDRLPPRPHSYPRIARGAGQRPRLHLRRASRPHAGPQARQNGPLP